MDDSYSYLVVRELFERLLYSLDRALYVCLDDYRELLYLALGYLAEQVVERYLAVLVELLLLLLVLSLLYEFAGKSLVLNCVEDVACTRNFCESRYLNRYGRSCGLDCSALVVGHYADTSYGCACDKDVALSESAVLNEEGRDRTSALVKTCLDDRTLCKSVGIGFKLLHLGNEKHVLEELVDALTRLCRNGYAYNVAAPVLANEVVLGELFLYLVGVCTLFIHFVDSNDYLHSRGLCMVDGLNRLRHDTVVCGNYKDSDIGDVRTSCTHGCECLMSRSIEEGDVLALNVYLISTDVLCDAACLACGNVSVSDAVEDRGLAVVNVSHNYYYGAARLEVRIVVVGVVDEALLNGDDDLFLYLCAELLSYERCGIEVYLLIYRSHYAESHELLDNVGSRSLQTCCELADCNALGYHYLELLLSCALELEPLELLCLGLLLAELLAVPLLGLLIYLLLLRAVVLVVLVRGSHVVVALVVLVEVHVAAAGIDCAALCCCGSRLG